MVSFIIIKITFKSNTVQPKEDFYNMASQLNDDLVENEENSEDEEIEEIEDKEGEESTG